MSLRDEIVKNARECKGVPFQHQGKTTRGMDCRGLLICAFGKAGLEVNDIEGYGREPDPDQMNSAMLTVCEKVPFHRILPADIIYFRFDRRPTHLALYSGNGNIIHSYLTMRRVVEHLIDGTWINSIVCVYRHKRFIE